MWPLSHSLYPGLDNDDNKPRARPGTAESRRTWYGNNRKSYASTYYGHHRKSIASSTYSRYSYAAQSPAEDLGDLIERSNHMLNVLSEDGDNAQRTARASDSASTIVPHDGRSDRSLRDDQTSIYTYERGHDGHESPPPPFAPHHQEEAAQGNHEEGVHHQEKGVASEWQDQQARESSQHSRERSIPTSSTSVMTLEAPEAVFNPPLPPATPTSSVDRRGADDNIIQIAHMVPLPAAETHLPNQNWPHWETEQPADNKQQHQSQVTLELPTNSTSAWSITTAAVDEKKPNGTPGKGDTSSEDAAKEEESHYLSGFSLFSVTLALSVAVFLVAMDVNVIATAIPHITGEFRSLDDVGWYGSAFLMTTCACQIPFGRIYSLFAAKWVFLSAIFIFTCASLVAALSRNSPMLIFGRAIQGVGTSGILSGGLIIMSEVVPLRMRPVLGGVIGAMEGVAMISAPIIGGILTDRLNWRWCFYINLPIGGFVLITVLVFLRIPKRETPLAGMTWLQILRHLDALGAVALLPPIVCTLLALHYAGKGDSWGDKSTILLLVLAVVLFVVFAYTQHINADVAMLPFRVAKQRSVLAGFWFILCVSSALVVITYFLPLWFQTVKSTSAEQSGIGILPMLVGVIIGVLSGGALVSLVGYYTPLMLASSAFMPVGLGLLSSIDPDTPRALLIVYPAIFGLGVGMGFQQPLIGVQTVLPKEDIATGTSIVVFGQTIGAAIIIAAGESVFQSRLVANIDSYLGISNVDPQSILGSGPSSLLGKLSMDQVPILIRAVSASLTQTFYLALAMAGLSVIGCVFMEWKSVKKPETGEKGAQA